MPGFFARVGIVALAIASSAVYSTPTLSPANNGFDWGQLKPCSKLEWVKCGVNRQCARLELPLSYADANDSRLAIIAITRIPSPFLGTDAYRGPILLNPGGPGGSGVDFIEEIGDAVSTIAGPQFDIVSFDPRGVSRSYPRVSFYESCEEGKRWGGEKRSLNSSSDAYAASWGITQIRNTMAYDRDPHAELKFVTTDLVARDMLEITQAMGFEKLKYWGFSLSLTSFVYLRCKLTIYTQIRNHSGSDIRGHVSDNVERLIIDGVADSHTYYSTLWDNDLDDTNLALSYFFEGCAAAGPEACAFYDETPELIRRNLAVLTASIRKTPLSVVIHGEMETSYDLVDFSMVRYQVFQSLHNPVNFPRLATALADLQKGNGTNLLLLKGRVSNCACAALPSISSNIMEANRAIACTDGEPVTRTFDELLARYEGLRDNASEWYEFWDDQLTCSGWKVRAPPRFTGPFTANTSHPLLLIGNTADPVTPLRSAHKMSKGFTGSVVLQQDSPGHCSLSSVSVCTAKYVRAYFQNGTLPDAGTVCAVDTKLFPPADMQLGLLEPSTQTVLVGDEQEDTDLLGALKSANAMFGRAREG